MMCFKTNDIHERRRRSKLKNCKKNNNNNKYQYTHCRIPVLFLVPQYICVCISSFTDSLSLYVLRIARHSSTYEEHFNKTTHNSYSFFCDI